MATDQPRRRADAERNTETILAATRGLLALGTLPSMSEVAAASDIGRVTLYKHFPTRELLVEAVVRRAITDTDAALSELALDTGPVEDALERMVQSSWPILDRHRKIRLVALNALGHEALRDHHDAAFRHVDLLIARGQDTGSFRTDLPRDWLVAVVYSVVHAAADEVDAGRLSADAAAETLTATLLATLRPPSS